jgi:AraC-like DNA-binding protein
MPLLQQYLYVIGSFQGLLLAFLLMFGSRISVASRLLGIWCLFLALSFLAKFITLDGELNIFTGLYGWSFFLPASYGALLYLYCRHAIVDRPLRPADLLHLLPLLICILLNLNILLAPPEVKLHIALSHPVIPFNLLVAEVILYLQAFVYIALSVLLIRKYQTVARHTLSDFNPEIFSWLWKLLLLDLVIWVFKAAGSIFGYQYPYFIIGDVLIIILIYSIAMAQWRNPRLFHIEQFKEKSTDVSSLQGAESKKLTLHSATSKAFNTSSSKVEAEINDATEDNNTGALDAETRRQILALVRKHMEEHKTFLDNQLTLTRLAEAVGVSTHHLSEVLNQHDGKNFYQFVNGYRISYVCERLKKDPNIKILDLALLSGFSSKSTFNAVFKQFLGQTPSQFREELALN